MFIDESSFSVRPMKNRLRVRRTGGNRLQQCNIVSTFKSGYQTIPGSGGLSKHGRTPLVGTIGSFTKEKYLAIIDEHVLPFMSEKHRGSDAFILQYDNCGPHRASSIATYLSKKDVVRMDWPTQSPDLNSIENIRRIMKSRLRKLDVLPRSKMHLFQRLSYTWNS